jgi:hypothetical protein
MNYDILENNQTLGKRGIKFKGWIKCTCVHENNKNDFKIERNKI